MDWFLYDRDLRHNRIKEKHWRRYQETFEAAKVISAITNIKLLKIIFHIV